MQTIIRPVRIKMSLDGGIDAILVVWSQNIFMINSNESCIVGIRKNTHTMDTIKNVIRIRKGFINLTNLCCENLPLGSIPSIFSIICIRPCKAPHNINVQFAPCQKPLTRKVTIIFMYWRNVLQRPPPSGYTHSVSTNESEKYAIYAKTQ